VARVTNLINKADALKQLNASLKIQKADYEKQKKEYASKKAVYDKEIVVYNKAIVAAAIAHLKSLDTKENVYRQSYRNGNVNIDFNIAVVEKQPESNLCEPSTHFIDRIEKQIRSVSIMAGETFNASMLDDDFFNCL
jgi:hypothetical protein